MPEDQRQRKLASIQRIIKLEEIPNADEIEVALVLGWKLVVKKGEFEAGDLCLYFEIDSLLPKLKPFEFLAARGTKKMLHEGKQVEGYRLKTIKLKGQISQGLALSIAAFPVKLKIQDIWEEGKDVTEKLGVLKYEPPIPADLVGKMKGPFPNFIPKTDEPRIQSIPEILEKYKGLAMYISEKLDGTSCTVYLDEDGEMNVCSRNTNWFETEGNTYWKAVRATNIEQALKDYYEGHQIRLVIQGEVVGEGIQKNTLKIKGQDIFIFNVFDITNHRYLEWIELMAFCRNNEIVAVPMLASSFKLGHTVDELIEMATMRSQLNKDAWAEGIVIRPVEEIRDEDIGRLSFKAINPKFLLKHDE